ncbi:THUMP domain-containing protein 3-like [Chelonus insularis]|uniref:THUMP domain-containing protein 3-like n=1 Tax=Chelonus insularis TaxID=460826 RepID=UPI00158D5DEB|nr:THUMP domain-containing protein 3-like [Chelonus insularis]
MRNFSNNLIMNKDKVTELSRIFEISRNDPNIITISATVDTGFEWTAIDECREKISQHLRVFKDRGKIYFNIAISDFPKVELLRSIDNIYLVADVQYLSYDKNDKDINLELLKNLVNTNTQLTKYLNAWKQFIEFRGKIYPTLEEYTSTVQSYKAEKEKRDDDLKDKSSVRGKRKRGADPSLCEENDVLSFRVTCERNGTHNFSSRDASGALGGKFQDKFHWIVDLTSHQLEILCRIADNETILNLRITPASMHRRNIIDFGPTTLRATICYNLLRLANPKPGDIIVDPMCGGGSIPIEAALGINWAHIIGGDNHEKAIERSKANFEGLCKSYKSDIIQWNITNLPFKDSSIDAIVTDMPFGKRIGSVANNKILYKKGLLELVRVVRMKYGRLVLFTHDRRNITMAFKAVKDYIRIKKTLNISMGGLTAVAYVLKRTNLAYNKFFMPAGESVKTLNTHKNPSNSSESD